MTQLLIVGTNIIAQGPFISTDGAVETADQIIPKHIIEGWYIVDVDVPEGFTPGGYEYINSVLAVKPPPPLTDEQRAAKRAVIQAEIDELERKDLAGRFVRESLIVAGADLAERMAEKMTAAGQPTTKEQVLAGNSGYQKALARNAYLTQLRTQMGAL